MKSELGLEELERKITFMGEHLLGSVRTESKDSWRWLLDEDTLCLYGRNQRTGLRILEVVTPQEDGGVLGHRFFFNPDGILKVIGINLSERELGMPDLQEHRLALNALQDSLGMTDVEDEHRQTFQRALQAPLEQSSLA